MALISLQQAKRHLKITSNDPNIVDDVLLKMDQASAIVLGRINTTEYCREIAETWTSTTVPHEVKAAMFLVLAHLNERHGDDDPKSYVELLATVDQIIGSYRDPVIA